MNDKGSGRIRGILALGAVALAAGVAASLEAQAPAAKQGWAPYLGCWEPQGAEVEEGVLCFVEGTDGVEMITILGGEVAYREPFPADGQPRAVEQDGCKGAESAWFSADDERLYTLSDVSCEGEAPRRTTGIISMPERGLWLDVRASEAEDDALAWSRWYQRVDAGVLEDAGVRPRGSGAIFGARARTPAFRSEIEIDDVVDASRNVHPEAVAAWIAEVGQEFRGLDAADLLRLDDQGVDDSVIDVVVAVSFPERFSVTPGERPQGREHGVPHGWAPRASRFGFFGYDPYYFGYSPYWSSRYSYYSPFGYYGGWWGGRTYLPVVVDVNRTPRGGGRVVAGEGYRRGGARDGDAPSYRPARPGGGATVGASSRPPSSPPARSSTGRKAKRRGGQ